MTEAADNPLEALAEKVFATPLRGPNSFDSDLWRRFLDSGLDLALCTGEPGALAEAIPILRAAGSHAAPIPVAEATCARALAHSAGWDDSGSLASVLTIKDDWSRAPWGRVAQVVYCVREGFIARRRGPFQILREKSNVADEPRDDIAPVEPVWEVSTTRLSQIELLARMALLKAAMMVGAMSGCLRIAVEHAKQRVQFDKPIGQFQAVQQMLADIAAETAAAAAATQFAAEDGSVFAAAVAKARASEAAAKVADGAHQITGAMGFTAEFPLHRLTRRLWAWRDENGGEAYWNRFVGETTLRNAGPGLWPLIASGAPFDRMILPTDEATVA